MQKIRFGSQLVLIVYIILTAVFCYGQQEDLVQEKKDSVMEEREIRDVISIVKEISSVFDDISEDDILKKEEVELSEKRGNSHKIKVIDKDKQQKKTFVFTKDFLKDVIIRDSRGSGYDITYYDNKQVNSFVEYKFNRPNGIFVKFYENGNLQYLATTEDGSFVGTAKAWDERGRLVENVTFEKKQKFKLEHKPPK